MFSIFQGFAGHSATGLASSAAAIVLSVAAYILFASHRYTFKANAPKPVSEGDPILGALRFFTARWDFFRHSSAHTSSGNFSFLIGSKPVVGLTGDKGRRVFFENRGLGFSEGYAVLFGQSPNNETTTKLDKNFDEYESYFQRRITRMLKTENFGRNLPLLMEDVQKTLQRLAEDSSGITDPFESIYRIVYQLTMRMVGCDDIANDPKLLEKTLGLFETIDQSATATTIIFPRFPSLPLIKRTIAGGRLYFIIQKIVEERQRTGRKVEDPLQYLMDQGDSLQQLIEFMLGALFAGLLNSGINAAWVLVYLAKDPYWLSKAREEVNAAAAKYNSDRNAPLIEQLSRLPLTAWESEFPILELCLRDSIRLQLLGTAFRKNVSGKDIPTGVGDEVIPPDAFVTYHTGDIHLDPNIYKDPEKWDPSRYLPDRAEDKKKPLSYLGWGVGRHPCLGMRLAKLEQNIIIAFFLAMFDFDLTNKAGVPLNETPPVDFNGHSAKKPSPPVYLKYTRRVQSVL